MATNDKEVQVLVNNRDLETLERVANLIDLVAHNPHIVGTERYEQLTNGLSQDLWSIVATIRHAQSEVL